MEAVGTPTQLQTPEGLFLGGSPAVPSSSRPRATRGLSVCWAEEQGECRLLTNVHQALTITQKEVAFPSLYRRRGRGSERWA